VVKLARFRVIPVCCVTRRKKLYVTPKSQLGGSIKACVVFGGSPHTLKRATLSVPCQCFVAHNVCDELDPLAYRNTRTDTCHASEPTLAFAASRLT